MSSRPFYRNTEVDAVRKINDDAHQRNDEEGFVALINAGGTATVQLSGSSNTIEAETIRGISVKNGDHVFLKRSKFINRWFIYAIGVTQLLSGATSSSGITSPTPLLTAPNTQSVLPDYACIHFQWSPSGVRPDLVYQVSVSDAADLTGEVTYLVAGGEFDFPVTPGTPTTKYFRVRSVDEDWNTSGWTSLSSATSLGLDVTQIETFNRREKETGEFLPSTFRELRIKINTFIGKLIHTNTANRTYTLPDNDGTIALTTDQPDLVQIEAFARRPIDTGNVKGPSSSVDADFTMFSGTTGKIIKDTGLALDTDGTLAANSDSKIPSQKAVKTYADSLSVDLLQIETFARRQISNIITLTNQVIGILRLKNGGTGSDLSATGGVGPNQFLKQAGVGANVSVGEITDADLPTTLSGHIISGGTIDSAPIGGTSPASGTFSALREKIGGFLAIFTHANSGDRTYTLPDYNATLATIAGTETFINKTLTTPTIGDFTNATHSHQNAAGGGTLDAAAIASGTLSNSRVNFAAPGDIGTTTPAKGYFSDLREKIGGFFAIFTHSNTADRTYTLPDSIGTISLMDDQTILFNEVFH